MGSQQEFNASDFLRGQQDCKEGAPPRVNATEDYLRGYGNQYQHEQNMEYLTRGHK